MVSRVAAVGLVAFSLFSVMVLNVGTAFAADDLWYPGEGVKQDMFVKYRIQEQDVNAGRPFEMTIYFKEQVDDDWLAPTFVVDEGRVINGTLKLAENMQALSGGLNNPPEMSRYVSAYHGSLHFLDAFTTQSAPLSLKASNWGKIGSIGGPPVNPSGTQKISFAGAQNLCQADSCDSTLILWHKSVDSKVWIVNEFLFPVKAEAYADVTTGQPPIQFKFELLETGMGQPELPTSAEQIPKPPLGPKPTARGTYEVSLEWDPVEIRPNAPVSFGITMFDSSEFPLERVSYDFTVKDSTGNIVEEFKNQNAALGFATHEVTFDSAGSMTVTVVLNSISGVPAGGGTFTESVDFNIVVVPEFPYSAAAIVAGVISILVLLTRARGLPSGLFGDRRAV